MKNKLLIITVSFLTISISFAQELIPLKTNNEWVYEAVTFVNDEEVSRDTVTNKVLFSEIINDKNWFYIDEFGFHFTVRNTSEGQVELDSFQVDNKGQFLETLVFKNPSSKIQTYKIYYDNEVTVDNKVTKVTTAAGTFKTYRYVIKSVGSTNYHVENFISPGVGIIRNNWTEGNQLIQYNLISYHAK